VPSASVDERVFVVAASSVFERGEVGVPVELRIVLDDCTATRTSVREGLQDRRTAFPGFRAERRERGEEEDRKKGRKGREEK
jgi:hypothetical protein